MFAQICASLLYSLICITAYPTLRVDMAQVNMSAGQRLVFWFCVLGSGHLFIWTR